MYGMVNNAIKDLISKEFGEDTWEAILEKSKVDDEIFISMNANPDKPTYDLVIAASEHLDTPVATLLEKVGEYWLLYTAKEGYAEMLDMFGSNVKEFLLNLNHLHSRVGSVMPNLKPPTFECTIKDENTLILHYHSERPALAALVKGILFGLSKKFNETIAITQIAFKGEGSHHDQFEIVTQ